jgi:hypothetical protein
MNKEWIEAMKYYLGFQEPREVGPIGRVCMSLIGTQSGYSNNIKISNRFTRSTKMKDTSVKWTPADAERLSSITDNLYNLTRELACAFPEKDIFLLLKDAMGALETQYKNGGFSKGPEPVEKSTPDES